MKFVPPVLHVTKRDGRANVGKAANDGAIISNTGHENYDDCVFGTIIKTGNDIVEKDSLVSKRINKKVGTPFEASITTYMSFLRTSILSILRYSRSNLNLSFNYFYSLIEYTVSIINVTFVNLVLVLVLILILRRRRRHHLDVKNKQTCRHTI